MLVASGDDGAGSHGFRCKEFAPTFPASSPHVTSVGGTYLEDELETAVDFSGGGFSFSFPRPSYQDAAVSNYLSTYSSQLPPSSMFNSSGRGIPDVSAVSTNFQVRVEERCNK